MAAAIDKARAAGAHPLILRCDCDDATARRRIAHRREAGETLSEALPEHVAAQRQAMEAEPDDAPVFVLDTGREGVPAGLVLAAVARCLQAPRAEGPDARQRRDRR